MSQTVTFYIPKETYLKNSKGFRLGTANFFFGMDAWDSSFCGEPAFLMPATLYSVELSGETVKIVLKLPDAPMPLGSRIIS